MTLFYFDVDDGLGRVIRDDDGVAYADMSVACHEAVKTLCEMGRDFAEHGSQQLSIIVREAEGPQRLRVILSLRVQTEH